MKLEKRIQKIDPIRRFRKHPSITLFQLYWLISRIDKWLFLSLFPIIISLVITYWLLKIQAVLKLVIICFLLIVLMLLIHLFFKYIHMILGFPKYPSPEKVAKDIFSINVTEKSYFTKRDIAKALYRDTWKILPAKEKQKAYNWADKVVSFLSKNTKKIVIEEHPFEDDIQIILLP